MNRRNVTFLAVLLLTAMAPMPAQVRGMISGYLTDDSGAGIPSARVVLRQEQTAVMREVESNETGFYQFPGLGSGDYTLSATAAGFRAYRNTGVHLTLDESLRVDIRMEVGAVTESVEVSAAAELVDSRTSTLSALVDDRRMVDLPLRNRNVISFAALLPGVTQVASPANTDLGTSRDGPRMTVNGSRQNQFYQTLNGTYFNHPSRNTGMNVPPPDAVRELRIKTSNYSAEEGRNSGAIVSVITRNGSNERHGSLWEFHRNSALNARSFFQGAKPSARQNQFGAAAGGPIVRDKLFWFGSYEGMRDRQPAVSVASYPPTAAERAGDFSHLSKALKDPFGTVPIPGNRIPASLFDPAGKNLLEFLPSPPPDGRLIALSPAPTNANLALGRLDWTVNQQHSLFVHYYFNQNRLTADGMSFGSTVPGWLAFSQQVRDQSVGLNHTWVLRPTLISQTTLGFTRSVSPQRPDRFRSNADLLLAGMPDYMPDGASQFLVSGRFNLRGGGTQLFVSNNYDVNENLTWIKGRHTMKTGFQYLDTGFFQSWWPGAEFQINGTLSGDAMADVLLGAYRTLTVRWGQRMNDDASSFTAAYLQDDFKVSRRLTLNLGLRYELPTPWVDKQDRLSTVDLRPGVRSTVVPNAPPGVLFVGDVPRGLYPADRNNFAPRVGFAWDLFGDGKSALRGGWGLFYDTLNADSVAQTNEPYAGTAQFVNGRLSRPLGNQPAPPVLGDRKNPVFPLPTSMIATDTRLRTPYVQQWNLTMERQVGKSVSLQGAYVGKTSRKLPLRTNFNVGIFQPGATLQNAGSRVPYYPGVWAPGITMLTTSFNAHYHAAQFKVDKRFSQQFTVMGSYTMGKSLDESSIYTLGGCTANPYDRRADRGRSDFDSRHTLAASWLWTPVRSRGGVVGRLVRGLTFSGVHSARSGYPLTFFSGDDVALSGACGTAQHPDLLRDPARGHASREDMVDAFFDKTAFAIPRSGTYGSAGRGILSGPAFVQSDIALLKDFMIREPLRLQFRAEFSNAFNQVNFNSVRTTMTDARFGQVNGASAGRAIQFGVKCLW